MVVAGRQGRRMALPLKGVFKWLFTGEKHPINCVGRFFLSSVLQTPSGAGVISKTFLSFSSYAITSMALIDGIAPITG